MKSKISRVIYKTLKWFYLDEGYIKLGFLGVYTYLFSVTLLDIFKENNKNDGSNLLPNHLQTH